MMTQNMPLGWPQGVQSPGTEGWDASAVTWLLPRRGDPATHAATGGRKTRPSTVTGKIVVVANEEIENADGRRARNFLTVKLTCLRPGEPTARPRADGPPRGRYPAHAEVVPGRGHCDLILNQKLSPHRLSPVQSGLVRRCPALSGTGIEILALRVRRSRSERIRDTRRTAKTFTVPFFRHESFAANENFR